MNQKHQRVGKDRIPTQVKHKTMSYKRSGFKFICFKGLKRFWRRSVSSSSEDSDSEDSNYGCSPFMARRGKTFVNKEVITIEATTTVSTKLPFDLEKGQFEKYFETDQHFQYGPWF
jgi:hypothetical protein